MSETVEQANVNHKRRGVLKALGGGALLAMPFAAATPSWAGQDPADGSGRERRVRRLTLDAFERQANGGDFYDILDDDVVWTVAAAEPSTHYSKKAFLTNGSGPVTDRLSTSIIPTVDNLWVQGDTAIIQWRGKAVARDGQPYRNNYCWIWTYRGDRVIRAVAFLDLVVLAELFERVPRQG